MAKKLTDAQLGKQFREGLKAAIADAQRESPHRRLSCHAFAYLSGWLKEDEQVARELKALAAIEYDPHVLETLQ